jgi:hypothetical protein
LTHRSLHELKNWMMEISRKQSKARFLVESQTVSAGDTLHCEELRLLWSSGDNRSRFQLHR